MITLNLQQWHKAICERDKYICQLQIAHDCKHDYSDDYYFNDKGINQYVCGDHLQTQGSSPELRLETTNGKCVCNSCHVLRHKGQVPEGYLKSAIEEIPTNALRGYSAKYGEVVITPGGITEQVCTKCQKFVAHAKGLCLQCQPFKGHNLKIKKEKKSK